MGEMEKQIKRSVLFFIFIVNQQRGELRLECSVLSHLLLLWVNMHVLFFFYITSK